MLTESQQRLFSKLHQDLGDKIISFLADKDINEVMLNPDGSLWVDSVKDGLVEEGRISSVHAHAILNCVAGIQGVVISEQNPRLEAELPYYRELRGERFTGQIPPIVANPCFTIRKKSEMVFTLDDYYLSERLTEEQCIVLKDLVSDRKNILVCGGPGSGKTTFTNALISEIVRCDPSQRIIILEDTPELQCTAPNKVSMVTSESVSMTSLVRTAMRMRGDRILVGEVRGAEALDMLKAWNTGCPGGICTVHANGCVEAIQRISDLAVEAGLSHPPLSLIRHTIDAVVFVTKIGSQKGFVSEICAVKEINNEKFILTKLGLSE
ncbi:MAG: P-type conjugative transfer ATPase TrbB [Gammaproteobacteria bacterium]|nr:P-type conjugative transfer ATPase TrbB [Gammaproteobacteria bacterium]